MIDLFIDPDTNIIYGIQKIQGSGDTSFQYKLSFQSPRSNKQCILKQLNSYPFSESIQNLDPSKYVYDENKNKLLLRPYFTINFLDSKSNKLNKNLLPLQTTIKCKVHLVNPDKLFSDQIVKIKVKDRTKFLTKFSQSKIYSLNSSKSYTFNIKSNYPGIAKLRIKDTNYLAYPLVIIVRFVQ